MVLRILRHVFIPIFILLVFVSPALAWSARSTPRSLSASLR